MKWNSPEEELELELELEELSLLKSSRISNVAANPREEAEYFLKILLGSASFVAKFLWTAPNELFFPVSEMTHKLVSFSQCCLWIILIFIINQEIEECRQQALLLVES